MAQTTILAAGNTEAESTEIAVAAGASITVGIFAAAGPIPATAVGTVKQSTPGAKNPIVQLTNYKPSEVLVGPGTYTVKRRAHEGAAVGVFIED